MAKCVKIFGKKRKVCIGNLDRIVKVNSRVIKAPVSDVDYSEVFTEIIEMHANIETVSGVTIFDSTNTERDITHFIYIRFFTGITPENWLIFNNEYYDIFDQQNLEERDEFFLLKCNKRGSVTKPVNEA
jgi:head-tail adaptor